jgi:hypothetical protein
VTRTATVQVVVSALGPPAATAPGAPTIGIASAGNGSATVGFTPPASDGGAPITGYTVISSPGNFTGTGAGSPIIVSGLVNGTPYTFTVTATNSAGTGGASAASNSVTPTAPITYLLTVSTSGSGTVTGPGINCGSDCTEVFAAATTTTVTASLTNFTGWTGCDSTSGASNSVCSVTMNSSRTVVASFAAPAQPLTIDLVDGFNLVGNPLAVSVDLVAKYGDVTVPVVGLSSEIESIWAWNPVTQKWRFHSPQQTPAQKAAYIAHPSRQYEALTSVAPGEGYWIKVYAPMTLELGAGAKHQWTLFNFEVRPGGFNLVTVDATMAPQQFNHEIGNPPAPATPYPVNFNSLWSWDAVRQKWYFYSPSFADGVPQSNAQYAAPRGLQDFAGGTPAGVPARLLEPGMGFWVDKFDPPAP